MSIFSNFKIGLRALKLLKVIKEESKVEGTPWYFSKRVWSSVLVLAASIAGLVSPPAKAFIEAHAVELLGAVGAAMAVIGGVTKNPINWS